MCWVGGQSIIARYRPCMLSTTIPSPTGPQQLIKLQEIQNDNLQYSPTCPHRSPSPALCESLRSRGGACSCSCPTAFAHLSCGQGETPWILACLLSMSFLHPKLANVSCKSLWGCDPFHHNLFPTSHFVAVTSYANFLYI